MATETRSPGNSIRVLRSQGRAENVIAATLGKSQYAAGLAELERSMAAVAASLPTTGTPQVSAAKPKPASVGTATAAAPRTGTKPVSAARPKPPTVSDNATGREIIPALRALGASSDYSVAVLEAGLTLGQARSSWAAVRGGAQTFIEHANRIGLSKRQALTVSASARIGLGARDVRYLGHAPASRDPETAWDSGSGEAVVRCKRFFGSSRSAFLAWANAEEDSGRSWLDSALELYTVR